MTIEEQVKQIKDAFNQGVINKAEAEGRKKSFLEQKEKIIEQCKNIGVNPEELGAKKQEKLQEIESKLSAARKSLNIEEVAADDDTPF